MATVGSSPLRLWAAGRVGTADDNLSTPVARFIDAARKEVMLGSQQLGDRTVVDALLGAVRRGCRVRVFLEKDYLFESPPIPRPWQATGENEPNRKAFMAILRGGIGATLDSRSALFHSNFAVRDPAGPAAAILVTSANFTTSCLQRHWESLALIEDATFAREFAREFIRCWEGAKEDFVDSPTVRDIGGVPVKAVFGPRHQPEMEVMKQIEKATQKVRFALYTFSSSSGLDDALSSAIQRGVDVQGVLDQQQQGQQWEVATRLRTAGAAIRWLGSETRKLHHKLVTVDDRVVILGTFNFSRAARFSHETILVIGDAQTAADAQLRIARGITNEIERLIRLGTP